MGTSENIQDILMRQRALLSEFEQEAQFLSENDLINDKERLEKELEHLQEALAEVQTKLNTVNEENKTLKNTLYEQIYNEKINILNHTVGKMDIYFRTSLAAEQDELTKLKLATTARIEKIKKELQSSRISAEGEIEQKLNEVTTLLAEKIAVVGREQATGFLTHREKETLEQLKEAPITEAQMQQLAKKNNLERLVGLNLLNKLGIFLIIIGVIAASHYSYVRLPDIFKGIMMFALGGAMLAGGEWYSAKKKASIFSLGITAGGVAILYVALSVSYFGLGIVSQYPALFLCVLITATAFLLSTRYNSQTILAFALIGGYLPIFSIGQGRMLLYAAMIYFVVLNLLALSVSLRRKWTVAAFVGLFLNMGGTAYICSCFTQQDTLLGRVIVMGYVIFAFLVYTLIPILGTYKEKGVFKRGDIVLIALNTLFSSVIMYWLFYAFGLGGYDGLLTICFALIYLCLGKLIEMKFSQEQKMRDLFYLTGFTFVVLTVPLQLGVAWLSMGWLIEGTALLVYGLLRHEEVFKRIGTMICGLCLASFILLDVPGYWNNQFAYKYFAITLGSVIILGALINTKNQNGQPYRLYKYGVLLNFWLYGQFLIHYPLSQFLFTHFAESGINWNYVLSVLTIVMSFVFAYTVARMKWIADHVVTIISLILYGYSMLLWLFLQVGATPFIGGITQTWGTAMLGTLLILGLSLLSLVALKDAMGYLVVHRGLPAVLYPLVMAGYFLMLLTQALVYQYQLDFSSAIISVIYVVTALVLIIIGFLWRYASLRRFGLGLAVLAVIKLFLVDLYTLTQGYKIVSYFALGLTLLVISFVYQYFNKHLAPREEGSDVQENQ